MVEQLFIYYYGVLQYLGAMMVKLPLLDTYIKLANCLGVSPNLIEVYIPGNLV